MNPLTIQKFEDGIKNTLIANYAQRFFGQLPPDEFVDTLHRIFRHKTKVIRNLALYVQREVEEKGRPADRVLQSLGFYATILKEFVVKNQNQPRRK